MKWKVLFLVVAVSGCNKMTPEKLDQMLKVREDKMKSDADALVKKLSEAEQRILDKALESAKETKKAAEAEKDAAKKINDTFEAAKKEIAEKAAEKATEKAAEKVLEKILPLFADVAKKDAIKKLSDRLEALEKAEKAREKPAIPPTPKKDAKVKLAAFKEWAAKERSVMVAKIRAANPWGDPATVIARECAAFDAWVAKECLKIQKGE